MTALMDEFLAAMGGSRLWRLGHIRRRLRGEWSKDWAA